MRASWVVGTGLLAAALGGSAREARAGRVESARVTLQDARGRTVGEATLVAAPRGLLLRARFWSLPPGDHALHLHEVGRCRPSFDAAGGHFNPLGRKHGLLEAEGHHAGDLANLHVPPSGEARIERNIPDVTLDRGRTALLDGDGAALVVHERADDHRTDPAGDAGARIACGVVVPAEG